MVIFGNWFHTIRKLLDVSPLVIKNMRLELTTMGRGTAKDSLKDANL